MTNQEKWLLNYEALKAYIAVHRHLPPKSTIDYKPLLNWAKYQRKRIKAGIMPADQLTLFRQLMATRDMEEHTGGRKRKQPQQ